MSIHYASPWTLRILEQHKDVLQGRWYFKDVSECPFDIIDWVHLENTLPIALLDGSIEYIIGDGASDFFTKLGPRSVRLALRCKNLGNPNKPQQWVWALAPEFNVIPRRHAVKVSAAPAVRSPA